MELAWPVAVERSDRDIMGNGWAAILLGGCALLAGVMRCAAAPSSPPPPPPLSGEGDFLVRCAPSSLVYRAAALRFARSLKRELEGGTGLPLHPGPAPLEIELGMGGGVAATVAHNLLSDGRGFWGLVRIADPGAAAPDDLRFAFASALLRTAIYAAATPGRPVREPPVWLARGLARYAVRERRGPDFEAAYALWSRARLPGVVELWSADSDVAQAHPAVAAQFVAWCVSRPRRRERWKALCRHLGEGGDWHAEALARIWCEGDAVAMDEAWDLWMAARAGVIFEPGTTPPGAVRRFRAQLLLFPWECDMPWVCRWPNGLPLAHGLEEGLLLGFRPALGRKAAALRMAAAGRDIRFQEMAGGFAAALESMAGGDAVEAATLWARAEDARRLLEASAAAGETLRTTAGGAEARER